MLRPVVLHILLLVFFTDQAAAQYDPVISSSWSMWSPWSFCSNNLMIRVRACSTVRGYKCAGHNKEFQSCSSAPPKRNQLDYDHQDPEAVDREMAMRQLYQDYEPGVPDNVEFVPKVPLMTRGGRPFMETRPAVPTTTTRPEPIEQIAQRFANSETSNLSVIPPQRNDDNFAVINMKEPSSTSSSTTTSEPIKTTTASEGEEVPASAEPGKEEEEEKLSLEERRGLEDVKSALEERLAEKERLLEEERRRQEEEERILEERRRQEEQKLQEERQALEAQKRQEEQRLAVERRLQKEKKLQEDQRRLQEEQGRLQEEQKVREEQRRLQEELKLQEEQRRLQAGLKLQEEQRRLQAGLKLQEEQRRLQQEEQLQEEQLRKLQEQERLQEEEKLQKERLQDKKRVQQEEQLQKELQLQEDGRRQEERRLSEERRLQVEHQLREDQRHQEDQRRIQEEVALKSRLEEAGRRVASQNSDFSLSDHEFSEKFGQSREPELSFGKPVVHLEDSEATSDSFPIEAEPESDFSGSTHSVGSYAIGKEPSVELPKFSIAHRAELPEVRRAPTQPSTSVAHVELPMSMIPEVVAPAPVHLVTANQKLRSMPRFMGEMKAYPRKVVPTTTTVPTPSPLDMDKIFREISATSVKPNQLTVEITSAPTKKKLRKTKTRRLKKLNRRGRMKVVAVVPTDATMVTEAPNEQKMSQNSNNIGRRVAGEASVTTETPIDTSKLSEKDRKVYEETKALEARLIALQHRVAVNKMKLEATRNSDPTDMLQGDTARALSWMIANMSRMVDDSPMDVMDVVPLDRVVEEKVSEDKTVRRIGSTNGLVRSKRSTHPSPDLKTLWSPWSEWSECECGRQKRKRVCLKQIRVASNGSAEQTFYPIEKSTGPPIEFPEPAPFPSLMSRNRIRRSNKCPAPQIESRACFSIKSCID